MEEQAAASEPETVMVVTAKTTQTAKPASRVVCICTIFMVTIAAA